MGPVRIFVISPLQRIGHGSGDWRRAGPTPSSTTTRALWRIYGIPPCGGHEGPVAVVTSWLVVEAADTGGLW